MPNKWINHVKNYAQKNNMKYNEALKDMNCKASYKDYREKYGGGIMEDGLNYVKNEGKKMVKNEAKKLVDKGADLIKNQVIGNGIFGDIAKGASNFLIDQAPAPNFVKDIGKLGTNYLVDKTGLGLKGKMKRKRKGGALYMA